MSTDLPRRFGRTKALAIAGRLLRVALRIAFWASVLVALVVLGRAFESRRLPDLAPWHRFAPTQELSARTLGASFTWAEVERREQRVFDEMATQLAPSAVPGNYRYDTGNRLGARAGMRDWNRSYTSTPAHPRGGVLLLHGLTDSPYSLRHVAALYERAGYAVIAPRLPGHGTVPAALLGVQWQDWSAVVRIAARELRARVGPGKPLQIVGYSNGGALALKYAMDVAERDDDSLPRMDRIVLLSPMIGLGRGAGFSRLLPAFGGLPYFEKSLWLDVQPEFNPYKYNSFPVNGAIQSYLLTSLVQAQVLELRARGRIDRLPPILGFQSVLDNTVSTPDVVHSLYDQLPANGSELVLFDINRQSVLAPMLTRAATGFAETLQAPAPRNYRLTVIGNTRADTLAVSERSIAPGGRVSASRPLGLAFPQTVYSLSHVALPFPMDDALYGLEPRQDEDVGISLGTIALHGERGALVVGADQLLRLNCNPFYPYLAARIAQGIPDDPPPAHAAPQGGSTL
jgi:alpha-beta hydrolase superfamily lysophospholipase